MPELRRGQVWRADLPDDKQRPVLIVSSDAMNRAQDRTIIVPITTTIRGHEVEVRLDPDRAPVTSVSVVKCDAILTLPKAYLIEYLGPLLNDELNAVDEALRSALGLDW